MVRNDSMGQRVTKTCWLLLFFNNTENLCVVILSVYPEGGQITLSAFSRCLLSQTRFHNFFLDRSNNGSSRRRRRRW